MCSIAPRPTSSSRLRNNRRRNRSSSLLAYDFPIALFEPPGQHGHVPIRHHFLTRPSRELGRLLWILEQPQHLLSELLGLIRQHAKLAVFAREPLRSDVRRYRRNPSRKRFEQL